MFDGLPPYVNSLFEVIFQAMMAESGDGDGFVFSRHYPYEDLANAFEEFLKTKDWHMKRFDDRPGQALFSDMCNENITFSNSDTQEGFPSWYTFRIYI